MRQRESRTHTRRKRDDLVSALARRGIGGSAARSSRAFFLLAELVELGHDQRVGAGGTRHPRR